MTAQLVIPIKLINFKFLRLNTLFKIYLFYYVNDSLACMYVYVSHVCLMPSAVRRGHWVSWYWSFRGWSVAIKVLVIEPWSFARATSSLNHEVNSPARLILLFFELGSQYRA